MLIRLESTRIACIFPTFVLLIGLFCFWCLWNILCESIFLYRVIFIYLFELLIYRGIQSSQLWNIFCENIFLYRVESLICKGIQLSQLARFSTYKTKLQNKQYHFKAPRTGWGPWRLIKLSNVLFQNTWLKKLNFILMSLVKAAISLRSGN